VLVACWFMDHGIWWHNYLFYLAPINKTISGLAGKFTCMLQGHGCPWVLPCHTVSQDNPITPRRRCCL
jgi:hypothetical protein